MPRTLILGYVDSCEKELYLRVMLLTPELLLYAGNANIDPYEPVIGAWEGEDTHQCKQGICVQRPEDSRINNLQVLSREHVICPQITGRAICEISSVECRVTLMGEVCSTLQRRLLNSTRAAWGYLCVHQGMFNQLLDRARDAIAIEGI